ncbi:MAG: hypothetical protein ACXVBC_07050 [Bdellovibrionota bacterium]
MDSWNVDEVRPVDYLFQVSRNVDANGAGDLKLIYRSQESLQATIDCAGLERSGEWKVHVVQGAKLSATGVRENGKNTFHFADTKSCFDENGKRVVREIHFKILQKDHVIFQTTVLPMYLRGTGRFYWGNHVDAYSAHGGSGSGVQVETAMAAERGDWDTWNGTLVKPTVSYFERNSIPAKTVIGLHRHEKNQDVFLMESGEAVVTMGMAEIAGTQHATERKWLGSPPENHATVEYSARGGWIERRPFLPGQIAVIVPDPKESKKVLFHGITAKSDTVFWTLGTKN